MIGPCMRKPVPVAPRYHTEQTHIEARPRLYAKWSRHFLREAHTSVVP